MEGNAIAVHGRRPRPRPDRDRRRARHRQAGRRRRRRRSRRQPSAAAQITGAVNLPLFLLEGVAILAEVFALLIVLLQLQDR